MLVKVDAKRGSAARPFTGKGYEDLVGLTATIAVGDLSVRVLSIEALIEEKKALGRDKDLAVIRLLEPVLRRRP